jgi:uncharacterized membrane protein YdjX (TVP38/TMEM64 family)
MSDDCHRFSRDSCNESDPLFPFVSPISLSSANDVIHSAQELLQNPSETLERVINHVDAMGPLGMVYFGLIYVLAEVLAIPAIPLTASAGYLFGVVQGTGIVLVSASIAASISFFIGKTFLRSRVEEFIAESPKFQKLDKAIGKEGLKLMLLVRIAPIFPFALSNYLYGASSVEFGSYFLGTLLGFTPGTVAYVYTGDRGEGTHHGDGWTTVVCLRRRTSGLGRCLETGSRRGDQNY